MGQSFLRLTLTDCAGLREAIPPLPDTNLQSATSHFCERLYLLYYQLESNPELEYLNFEVTAEDIMIINNSVSSEAGDWARALLQQTREAFYEIITRKDIKTDRAFEQLVKGIDLEKLDE